jgi:hypothetical protein
MAPLCFAAWCLFGAPVPHETRVVVAQDAYATDEQTDRLALVEAQGAFVGVVDGNGQAAIAGLWPLRVRYRRLHVDGGVSLATRPVPVRGTHANWIARAEVRVVSRLTVAWFHLSNAQGGGRNPSIDALAVGWSF